MNIPLDRLYQHLRSLVPNDVVVMCWTPHGSKKLEDLNFLDAKNAPEQNVSLKLAPIVICHDQEPLMYDFYDSDKIVACMKHGLSNKAGLGTVGHNWNFTQNPRELKQIGDYHLKMVGGPTLYPHIVLHSEIQSKEAKKYEDHGFVTSYYWCHAVLARDWYRYAESDPALKQFKKTCPTDFLIYARAWTGSREYRLKFLETLQKNNLQHQCKVYFSPTDTEQDYLSYKTNRPQWQIDASELKTDSFLPNSATSNASADYDADDYNSCNIEVVCETLFDDDRWHLTEKTLRPIACSKPFIVLSAAGVLQYLRSYGFKTFAPHIDESYDLEPDAFTRMLKIIAEMKRISQLPTEDKKRLLTAVNRICVFNKKRFFSKKFIRDILDEYQKNISNAVATARLRPDPEFVEFLIQLRRPIWPEAADSLQSILDDCLNDL